MRAGVIGFGHLGRHHGRIYSELKGVELAYVADNNQDALNSASHLGAKLISDYREMIGKVDLVSVVTPTESHMRVASELIKSGIHVLVEKPLAKNYEDARALAELARKHGVTLQVGHIERFNPVVTACKKMFGEPRFIQADRVSPYSFRSVDIGVVMDIMIHDIDLILYMVGSRVAEVSAMGVPVIGEHEDIANTRIIFENGCVANVTASRVAIKTERKIRLFQPDAYISMDLAAKKAVVFRKKGEVDLLELKAMDARKIKNPLKTMLAKYIERKSVKIKKYEPLAMELESFVNAVKKGIEPEVTGEDGAEDIRVADLVLKSLASPPWTKSPNGSKR